MRLAQVPGGGGGEARGLSLTAGLPATATAFAAAFDRTHLDPAFKWIVQQATLRARASPNPTPNPALPLTLPLTPTPTPTPNP